MDFSAITTTKPLRMLPAFEASQLRAADFPGSTMSPFVMVDHFRMYERTFEEHPHAGISAVTLMFEDTTQEMVSIDSLKHVARFGAGDLHWTLAGRGITHNQMPAAKAGVIHALQIFVNLPPGMKDMAPDSFLVSGRDMPVVKQDGLRIRVVAGRLGAYTSPAPLPQPVLMLDATADGEGGRLALPLDVATNALIIPIKGEVRLPDGRTLKAGEAVAATNRDTAAPLMIEAGADAHFVVLAGPDDPSPLVSNGPFVYPTIEDLRAAEARYRAGEFGHCPPVPPSA
ncbi:MAG: pirin family protein [Proteobacteria bacterium]|nr:pirin family protein [Pseudomonadota bacterium]